MEYIGIQTQIRRNNQRTALMLVLFPVLVSALVWLFFFIILGIAAMDEGYTFDFNETLRLSSQMALYALPWVMAGTLLWFTIAYFINVWMIRRATRSETLSRQENKRIYNLVENLCMAEGIPMPKVNVIEDVSLNAFASGINQKTYTVTLTRGIIDTLDDDELEGVIAHELTHIRNRDVRLLIVTIVFVGIFSTISYIALRSLSSRGKKNGVVILAALVVAGLGMLLSSLMRFSISRKREFMADAGAATMTKKPQALTTALRKISGNAQVTTVTNKAVAQLFIENALEGGKRSSLFASHPPIVRRIEVLEQF